MDSQEKYQIAYKKHYNEREVEAAYILYKDIIDTYPNSKDAEYAKIQMGNIIEKNPNIMQEIHKIQNMEIDKLQQYGKCNERSKFLFTTTNSIDGKEIDEYLGIVSDRLVVGAGLFSEVFASFTDVFGGRSNKFESSMADLNSQMMNSLEEKAKKLDADAIVGLNIDLDEISGKGFQMFMMSGVGTAVKFKKSNTEECIKQKEEKLCIADEIEKLAKLKDNGILTIEEFERIKQKIIK